MALKPVLDISIHEGQVQTRRHLHVFWTHSVTSLGVFLAIQNLLRLFHPLALTATMVRLLQTDPGDKKIPKSESEFLWMFEQLV